MNYKVVQWAMDDAPMTLTGSGKPDTTARHVLQVLAETAREDGSNSFQSIPTIEYRTGYDRRTIQRAFKRLELAGLISQTGLKYGTKVWKLSIWLHRPASDREAIQEDVERSREAAAERQRKSRARRVTHSGSVTPDAEGCTCHALQVRDVTHSECVSHGRKAAVSIREPEKNRNPTVPADRSPTDMSKKAAAPPSLRSGGLPLIGMADHLPPEDVPPVVGTATIPGQADLAARFWTSEIGDRCEAALSGKLSPEALDHLVEEMDRLKRHHMQGCDRCQRRTSPCDAGAPLVAAWAQLGGLGHRVAQAPF